MSGVTLCDVIEDVQEVEGKALKKVKELQPWCYLPDGNIWTRDCLPAP